MLIFCPQFYAMAARKWLLLFFPLLICSQIFAQSSGAWYVESFTGSTPEKRHESGFVKLNEKFYLIGGRGTKKIQVYDPKTNKWSNTNTSTQDIHHFQAISYQGKIYIMGALTGGYPNEKPVPHILIYNPTTDKLVTGPSIPSNRRRGASGAVVHQGKFYLICGNRNGHSAYLNDGVTPANVTWFDVYNPASNTWKVLPNAPRARDHFFAQVINNKLYLAAGRRSRYGTPDGPDKDMEAAVDVFNFETGQWLSGSALPDHIPTKRAGAATGVLNGELIVAGGETGFSNLAFNTTEALNPATGKWRTLANLTLGRHATQAITYQGDMYFPAGSKTRGATEILASEAYLEVFSFDGPPQNTITAEFPNWKTVSQASKARAEVQGVYYQGEMYFFNGFAKGITIENSCVKYNPKTQQWTSLAKMPLSGGKSTAVTHAGVALVDDVVWIVGGRIGNDPGPVTKKVWWYKISTNTWQAGPALPFPVGGGGLAKLGRKLHYFGGFDAYASCDANHHLVYDLDNTAAGWQNLTSTSPMPEPRNHFGTAVLNGKVYLIAGQDGHDGCQKGRDVKTVHSYDPVTNTYKKLADFPNVQSHIEPSTFAHNGKIYVVGGEVKGNEVYSYDPLINQWKLLTDYTLPEPLLAPFARVLGDTLVVALGGAPNTTNPTNKVRFKTFSLLPNTELPGDDDDDDEDALAGYWLEAECATVGSAWETVSDPNASNNEYLVVNGKNALNNPPAQPNNIIRFEVDIQQAGSYHLWVRIQTPNINDDSFWVRVNNGSWIKWWQGITTGSSFAWKEILNSPFNLKKGLQVIEFAYREDGARFDKLHLTLSTEKPENKGEIALACDSPTSPFAEAEGVTLFTLINADTDQEIGPLTNGSVIDINQTPHVNVRADTDPYPLGSVFLELSGSTNHQQTENHPLYALFGNQGNNYEAGTFNTGSHQLKATAYAGANRKGEAYTPLVVNFKVVKGNSSAARMTAKASSQEFLLYPNPAQEQTILNLQGWLPLQPIQVEVIDAYGQVRKSFFENHPPDHQFNILTYDLPLGVYTVQVTQGKFQQRQRLVKK